MPPPSSSGSAQAGMGSGVEGRGEQGASPSGSGSRKSSPSVSPAVAASIPRADDPDEPVLIYHEARRMYWCAFGRGMTDNPHEAFVYLRGTAEEKLKGYMNGMSLIPARDRPLLPQPETFETIAQWCESTFGPVTLARIATRANEEMVELLADPERVEEAADVVIVLSRYPGLWAAVERKMAANRARKWRVMGDGTGYHVPTARVSDEPPQGENASAVEGEAGQRGGKAETPSQSPDPLSQTVAPSTEEKG